ncbi:MAG: ATP-binding protein [Gemmatimonadota bacterium]
MNVNKLFPRLSIRAKLAIAFLALASVPALAFGAGSTWLILEGRRARTEETIQHDLERATLRVSRSLAEVRNHLALARVAFAEPWLLRDSLPARAGLARFADAELSLADDALFRIKVFDAQGDLLLQTGPSSADAGAMAGTGGMLYLVAVEGTSGSGPVYLPVELADGSSEGLVPAVAVLEPVRDAGGELVGILAGEARASTLFAGIDDASPELPGRTAVVRADGLYLYHSGEKRDWNRLLAEHSPARLSEELGSEALGAALRGESGTRRVGNSLVGFTALGLGTPGEPPLVLYRSVSMNAILAPLQRFLLRGAGGAAVMLAVVLSLAVLAARQLTRPLYRLRTAAGQVARGEDPAGTLQVETNDELEDLAADFDTMSRHLQQARHELESLVEERTRALEVTRAELSEVITHSADAIIGLDPTGRIRLWNLGAEALFGYTVDEAIGEDGEDLLECKGPETEHERAYIRQLLAGDGAVVNLRTQRRHRDGSSIPVSLTHTRIRGSEGRSLGASLVIRDDRMHAQLEEHMRRSERLAAVSIMAAGLAHELNNPLSILCNRMELILGDAEREGVSDRLQRDLQVVGDKVERIQAITSDLLSFAREGETEPQAVAVGDVLGRLLRLFDRTLRKAGVHACLDWPTDLPLVYGNEKAIETIFANLILNAQQAMTEGGEIFFDVRVESETSQLAVDVFDSGPGVPPELRKRVFEPFFTTKNDQGGTGLGLAVCRAIAERLGGSVAVDGPPDGPSRFTVRLPIIT